MALYNYNTAFVVLDTTAYNATEQNLLENYLYDVFGQPAYEDNTTIAFTTSNAITNSVFRNFVAYPLTLDWEPAQLPYNGTTLNLWIPLQYGAITLSVPYTGPQNATANQTAQYSNTITAINFTAISINANNQTLDIEAQGNTGPAFPLGSFQLTNRTKEYGLEAQFPVGQPVQLFFIPKQAASNAYIGIYNITFSEGTK